MHCSLSITAADALQARLTLHAYRAFAASKTVRIGLAAGARDIVPAEPVAAQYKVHFGIFCNFQNEWLAVAISIAVRSTYLGAGLLGIESTLISFYDGFSDMPIIKTLSRVLAYSHMPKNPSYCSMFLF